ncbi:uncharacterized protein LOC114915969 [Cajanus cajan]|uniref:Transmembrane protein n=1 Tax=Cajanus cajan TaxID=3821 RepID=A0A151TH06_CAJCA|nr:uncharacterized protein LOC114915969 [Cajanus cajan]KYP66322.1 hypothetical protein KK1_012610 [Cajanus cajan]
MTIIQSLHNSISKLLNHPLLWRLTGFVSSIVGISCYALSPSFQHMFGQWNPLKIVVYTVVASLLSIFMLFVPRCSWGLGRSLLLKAHVGFVVLTLTSLWSVLEDRSEEGKVESGFGKMMNVIWSGAFGLMAMSLSRQLQLGFEVGVSNFLVGFGCFLVTLMKMNLKLAPVAAFLCYLVVNVRSVSDLVAEMRSRCGRQHADEKDSESEEQDTDSTTGEDFDGYFEDYSQPMQDFYCDLSELL